MHDSMTNPYILEVRVSGKNFHAELISPREVAAFLVSIEDMITSIVIRDHRQPGLKANDVVLGFSSITQGSLDYLFTTPYENEVREANQLATQAVTTGDFSMLPSAAVDAVKEIRRFNRQHGTTTTFGQHGSSDEAMAVITGKTPIKVETRTIKGTTSLYGKLIRIGGDNPPRAWLKLLDGTTFSCRVQNTTLALQMAQRLYQRIGVRGVAHWNISDMSLRDFRVEQLLPYQHTSVANAFSALGEVAAAHYAEIDDIEAYIVDLRGSDEPD